MSFGGDAFTLLVCVAWATVLLWLVGALLTWRSVRGHRALAPAPGQHLTGAPAPLVSVLVPARNEEHRVLEEALRSMLAQDYGRLEVIAVNDRSTDLTGPILHALARADARLRVIEGAEPPAGWLGKPHAMRQALAAARGEWVLATDADIIFEPAAVRTALAHALEHAYDALTLLPRVVCLTFWERVFMPSFGWFMLTARPLARVNDPRRKESLGIGGFFLIRRELLARHGGYDAVRDEVAEDLRLAEILKGAGARLRVEDGSVLVRTRMHATFGEIWEGFTRNLFAGAKFSLPQTLVGSAGVLLFSVAPPLVALSCAVAWASGAFGGAPAETSSRWAQLFAPTFFVWLAQTATFAVVNRAWGVPVSYSPLAAPLGHALFVAILLNSAARVATGRGVTWKGRKLYEREGVPVPRSRRGRASWAARRQ